MLKSNLNAGLNASSKSKEDLEFEKRFYEAMNKKVTDHSRQPNKEMDPEARKEAEYLANLELKPGATFEQIKSSYKALMKMYHPDKYARDEEKRKFAELVTSKLNEAYSYFERKYKG